MAIAVISVPNGLPVSQSPNGLPVTVSTTSFGLGVTPVAKGGMPVTETAGGLFGPATIPVNTGLPFIIGTPQVGNTLMSSSGTWSGSAATYTFQWKRGGVAISGATTSSYLLVSADLAAMITVTVTATNTAGNASATSAAVGPVTNPVVGGMTLAWTSAYTVYDPVFTLTFYDAAVGDVLTLQIDDNSDFSSLYASDANTLDSAEIAAGTITYAGITTLLPGVTYYARVKMTRAAVDTYSNTVSQTMYIDSVAPTVMSFVPADNATSVAVGVELVVTFSETIVMGTGTISLKKTSDNSTVDSWNVATAVGSTAGKVEIIGGTTLHMHLTSNLANTTEYYVVWPAGVVKDVAGNNVAAQSSTTIWSFTTAVFVTALTFTPTDVTQPWQIVGNSPFTFNCNIGTAAADRIIVVNIYVDGAPTVSDVAIGSVHATPVVFVGNINMWAFAAGSVALSGSQNIVVTTVSAFPSGIEIMVGTITGSATATLGSTNSVGYNTSADPHSISATVPTNGVAVVSVLTANAFTPLWTGATEVGHVTEAGASLLDAVLAKGTSSTVSFTGANGLGNLILMATWGP